MTRQQIEDIIERTEHSSKASVYYDWFMVFMIIVSILPLMFMQTYEVFKITEGIATVIFIIDYVLRWITADLRLNKFYYSFSINVANSATFAPTRRASYLTARSIFL